jgi:NADH:ubiquinone oxidoreductase subunit E
MHPSPVDHIPEILARFDDRRSNLVPLLRAIQDEYTYLPEGAAHRVAVKLHVPVAEVFQVAQSLKKLERAAPSEG